MSLEATLPSVDDFERAADEYAAAETLEDFMESVPHGRQKLIVNGSLAALQVHRPEVTVFNELLIQFHRGSDVINVVPDTCVILSPRDDPHRRSYKTPYEPAPVFWVLEYVSPRARDRKKDYEENFAKYEEFKVPYCLMFDPDTQRLDFFRHTGEGYEAVAPSAAKRFPLPELDLEIGLLDEWVRFWHLGQLLPTMEESAAELHEAQVKLEAISERDRRMVQRLAQRASRADILAALDTAAPDQIGRWLEELFE